MTASVTNVLFLCTGNSARSILAERLMEHLGAGRFHGHSAGSHPTGKVNPFAVALLREEGLSTDHLRSKSWDVFAEEGAPTMDLIITVCDQAAGEMCPVWPGRPMAAHWGVPDPAAVTGSDVEKRAAFRAAYDTLKGRIAALVALPVETLDRATLLRRLRAIGGEHA